MRYGVCARARDISLLAAAGYDYVELSVAGDLSPESDASFWESQRRSLEALPLPIDAYNSFVRTGKIVGPEADPARLERYVHAALARAAQLGSHVIVFGSGGARQIPENWPREKAEEQLEDFLHHCADAYETSGVTVAIEPLHRAECNFLNRVSEGAAWARRIGRPGVTVLADTYHMDQEDEPLAAVVEAADVLAHVHVADTGRRAPATGVYDFVALFQALRQAGYDRRVSIECSFGDLAAELGPALLRLKAAWQAANP